MGSYGERGEWAFIPVSIGVFLGAGFVYSADLLISSLAISSPLDLADTKKRDTEWAGPGLASNGVETELRQRHRQDTSQDGGDLTAHSQSSQVPSMFVHFHAIQCIHCIIFLSD